MISLLFKVDSLQNYRVPGTERYFVARPRRDLSCRFWLLRETIELEKNSISQDDIRCKTTAVGLLEVGFYSSYNVFAIVNPDFRSGNAAISAEMAHSLRRPPPSSFPSGFPRFHGQMLVRRRPS